MQFLGPRCHNTFLLFVCVCLLIFLSSLKVLNKRAFLGGFFALFFVQVQFSAYWCACGSSSVFQLLHTPHNSYSASIAAVGPVWEKCPLSLYSHSHSPESGHFPEGIFGLDGAGTQTRPVGPREAWQTRPYKPRVSIRMWVCTCNRGCGAVGRAADAARPIAARVPIRLFF